VDSDNMFQYFAKTNNVSVIICQIQLLLSWDASSYTTFHTPDCQMHPARIHSTFPVPSSVSSPRQTTGDATDWRFPGQLPPQKSLNSHLQETSETEKSKISSPRYLFWFLRATRMHSTDHLVARCLSVCPTVRHTPVFCLNNFFHFRAAPPF